MRQFCPRGNHDKLDDGIRNCRRRHIAGLPLLMTRLQNRRANRSAPGDGFLPGGGNYTAAEGWIISSRLGSDNPAFDSSGNPSDPGGGDSGGGGAD
jgi:hypothetical protein